MSACFNAYIMSPEKGYNNRNKSGIKFKIKSLELDPFLNIMGMYKDSTNAKKQATTTKRNLQMTYRGHMCQFGSIFHRDFMRGMPFLDIYCR